MAGVIKFFTDNPIARLIAYIILALLGWEVVKRHLKEAGREAERKAIAIKQAEEQRRVEAARREITEGNNEARHQADEAVSNLPQYRATDELRRNDPDAAAIVLGSGERRSP